MYLLGLGLLVLSTWYLLKLFDNFNNDKIAKSEIREIWQAAKKEVKGKNPFLPGRIRDAINTYKADIAAKGSQRAKLIEDED
tara:strand:+ start:127 stop:372 length:246 start_codon:yes stop_codon:yes gene_type:complete